MAVIFLIALLMIFSQCGHSYKIRINLYIIVEYDYPDFFSAPNFVMNIC